MRRLLVAWLGVVAMCCCGLPVAAQTLEVDGSMRSDVAFELTQGIALPGGAQRVSVSFVVPEEFVSPTFVQKIRDYSLRFSPRPDARENTTDIRGNRIITATWSNPPRNLDMTVSFQVDNQTLLQRLETTAVFPVRKVPPSVAPYLESSEQVQADDARIRALAERLTGGASTEYEAVQRIVGHVVDNLRYVNPPEKFDALYSLETGKGNCQNYSHLCAALLRASGIPARIVNGYTLGKPYSVQEGRSIYTFKSADGRHSWIEVWFPDLGWVPFDAQKTSFFVANRFIRVETGMDNKETVNDGRIRYVRLSATSPRPRFKSGLGGDFTSDAVALKASRGKMVTSKLLLFPGVDAGGKLAEVRDSAEKPKPTAASLPVPAVSAPSVPNTVAPEPVVPKPAVSPHPAPTARPAAAKPGTEKPAVEKPAVAKSTTVPPTPARPENESPETEAASAPPPPVAPAPEKTAESRPVAPSLTKATQAEDPVPAVPEKKAGGPQTVLPVPPDRPRKTKKPELAGRFSGPVVMGNLDFPENMDFTDYGTIAQVGEDQFEVTRNFLVESAEYVTTRATQYAQVFRVKRPLSLENVSLALHRYGGGGMLWVDLFADADGTPGRLLAASGMVEVGGMSLAPGYRWQTFDFSRESPVLDPGYYWIGLGFAGDPIISWFYTYGKPVGPLWGTRSRDVFDEGWSSSLDYEFNFRVAGENLVRNQAGPKRTNQG